MYKKGLYTIVSNEPLTPAVYRMVLEGDTQYITRSGQFVNIELEGKFLRRPISVCDYDATTLTIIYKVVGSGTEQMRQMERGKQLDILTGLGNGFSTENEAQRPLLVGGGVGVPPMYNLCKRLLSEGKQPRVVLGFNTQSEVFYKAEFEALGVDVYVATADGSMGIKGFVTDAIREAGIEFDYLYTCGPLPMLRPCTTLPPSPRSSASRSAWVVALVPAWVARARPNMATSVSARMVPYLKERRLYGKAL